MIVIKSISIWSKKNSLKSSTLNWCQNSKRDYRTYLQPIHHYTKKEAKKEREDENWRRPNPYQFDINHKGQILIIISSII